MVCWFPLQAQQQKTAADKLIDAGHYLRAQPLVQAALAKNPNDVHALSEESVLQWAFFHESGFMAAAQKAVAVDGNSAEAHAQLSNAMGEELANSSAGFMARLNATRVFRKEAERALQLNPNNTDALQDMAEYEFHAPGVAGGDKVKSLQLVDQIAKIDPERAYALLAEFAADDPDKSKRQSAVEVVWKRAVAALPQSYAMRCGLANAYLDAGNLGPASEEASKAVSADGSRVLAYVLLAEVYATQGRWADVDAVLKRARAAVPDDLTPEYQAARVILAGNVTAQMARAEGYLRDYLKQPAEGREPSLAAAHWRLGLVLEKEGRKPEAVNEVQTAVNMDGSLDGAKKDLKRMK